MTAFAAVLITLMSEIRELQHLLLRFPELLIAQIGCILLIAEFFDLRLLQRLNPTPVKKHSYSKSGRRAKAAGKTATMANLTEFQETLGDMAAFKNLAE